MFCIQYYPTFKMPFSLKNDNFPTTNSPRDNTDVAALCKKGISVHCYYVRYFGVLSFLAVLFHLFSVPGTAAKITDADELLLK